MAYSKTTKSNSGGNKVVKQVTTGNPNYSNYGYAYTTSAGTRSNATLDPTRTATNVTYGGTGRNASTGDFSNSSSSSSGSSSSGSGSSSGKKEQTSSSLSWDPNGLYDVYMNTLAAKAQDAYNRNMGVVNDLYKSAADRLNENYDESVGILDRNNANNRNAINADAENAMRQAYINNMLSRKSLQQAMTAQGLNGGATETTRASMENNYGNARNNIDRTRNKNLADLLMQYENNLAGLRQQLNSGLSDLDERRMGYAMQINDKLQSQLDNYGQQIMDTIQAARDRAAKSGNSGDLLGAMDASYIADAGEDAFNNYNLEGMSMGNLNNYAAALNNLARNSAYFNATPTEITNPYEATSMQQAGVEANSNYARMLQELGNLGANNTGAVNTSIGANRGVSSLEQILRALYGA